MFGVYIGTIMNPPMTSTSVNPLYYLRNSLIFLIFWTKLGQIISYNSLNTS